VTGQSPKRNPPEKSESSSFAIQGLQGKCTKGSDTEKGTEDDADEVSEEEPEVMQKDVQRRHASR